MRKIMKAILSKQIFLAVLTLIGLSKFINAQTNNIQQTTTLTSTTGSGGCFSYKTLIQLQNSSFVKINELMPGDYIRTYDHSSKQIVNSRFIDYLHFDKSALFKFISIKTADETAASMPSLEISEYHLIQRLKRDSSSEHEFVFAKDLVKGDKLFLMTESGSMKYAEITELEEVYEQGAYAPLTEHGTLWLSTMSWLPVTQTCSSRACTFFSLFTNQVYVDKYVSTEKQCSEHMPLDSYMNNYLVYLLELLRYRPFSIIFHG